MDLQAGWDFSLASHRTTAIDEIKENKPPVIVGWPPCTMISVLQNLNVAWHGHDPVWMEAYLKKVEEATVHIRFCCTLCHLQTRAGRYLLHEHPWSAQSWEMTAIHELSEGPRVCLVQAHQCRFGQVASGLAKDDENMLVKKPICFLTNSWCIAEEPDKRCMGGHPHGWLLGGRAAHSALYPDMLCESIYTGIMTEKAHDKLYGTQGIYLCDQHKSYVINNDGECEQVNMLERIVEKHVDAETAGYTQFEQ